MGHQNRQRMQCKNLKNEQTIRDLAEPLLDEKFIRKVIESWTRPLPINYLSSPLILSGPSGVGKNQLLKQLLNDYAKFFKKVVTYTTRSPRIDEVNGTHYHFVSRESFEHLVQRGDFFMEHSHVHSNRYGLPIDGFKKVVSQGKIPIFEIDVQGATKMKRGGISCKFNLSPKYLFIAPTTIDALRARLITRGTETEDDIALRLANAVKEIAASRDTELFDRILLNADFELTVNAFFRTARDWYPALPSPSRLRMLQRRISRIKILSQQQGNDTIALAASDVKDDGPQATRR